MPPNATHNDSDTTEPDTDSNTDPGEDDELYEVVIRADGGYEKEHAELLRKRLLGDGFHDHVVTTRPIPGTEETEHTPE